MTMNIENILEATATGAAMHNKVLQFPCVVKDKAKGTFVRL